MDFSLSLRGRFRFAVEALVNAWLWSSGDDIEWGDSTTIDFR